MEGSHFCPPEDARFHIGSTYINAKISPKEIVRRGKTCGGHRPFNKNRPIKSCRVDRKVLQRSIASRSSALRNGKLAEARTGLHSNEFDAVQAAARKAHSSPITIRTLTYINACKRHRKMTSSRCIQHTTVYSAVDTRGVNMPIIHGSNMFEIATSADEDNPSIDDHH